MKFSKLLSEFEKGDGEEEKEPLGFFLQYKSLKKVLKAAAEKRAEGNEAAADEEEKHFIDMLQNDLRRINAYFIEREEEAVIQLQTLSDRRASLAPGTEESLRSSFVDFHGELVLLLHWSLVNYAGVAKILKKHQKLLNKGGPSDAGAPSQAYMMSILHQPFVSTEAISRLVRESEAQVSSLRKPTASGDAFENESNETHEPTNGSKAAMLRRTKAALGMLTRLQGEAHTPSTLLPADADGSVAGAEPAGKRAKVGPAGESDA